MIACERTPCCRQSSSPAERIQPIHGRYVIRSIHGEGGFDDMNAYHAPISASLLAKWFVRRAAQASASDLDNLKLQKLLFLADSRYAHSHGKNLVRERIEAWKHGPVVDVVYQEYKPFGDCPIKMQVADDGPWSRLPAEVDRTLEDTWDAFAVLSGWALRELTHEVGPWKDCYRPPKRHAEIPKELIGIAWPSFAAHAADRGPEAEALLRLDSLRRMASASKLPDVPTNAENLIRDYESLRALREEATSLLS